MNAIDLRDLDAALFRLQVKLQRSDSTEQLVNDVLAIRAQANAHAYGISRQCALRTLQAAHGRLTEQPA